MPATEETVAVKRDRGSDGGRRRGRGERREGLGGTDGDWGRGGEGAGVRRVAVIDRAERVRAGGQVEGEGGYTADEGSGCVDCSVDEEADGAGWVGGAGDGGRRGEASSEGCGGDDSA